MKNVQIIDGAINTAYNIYGISDEDFELMFPNGQDIEFIEDFLDRVGDKEAARITEFMWKNLLRKPDIHGIHGTLFYELKPQKVHLYPTKKFSDDPSTTR
ncbi:hypothetical protein B5V01_20300 [Mesorhizobium erdmanii]|uniref:Uncharacterized protein n=2 Tax=Mesorhizobium TaxID=68287 RepID=A0A3M9X2Q3_9HYPH|nr:MULTISPECIES: hypothetical protein [Mesorhizobium]RNJ42135.1 hypothetical protein DNR46_30235 [Mesorhizobium japonicum]RXT43347.1 hypothetical protein B5V01_20300 [Mesorhizobium erdmanii]